MQVLVPHLLFLQLMAPLSPSSFTCERRPADSTTADHPDTLSPTLPESFTFTVPVPTTAGGEEQESYFLPCGCCTWPAHWFYRQHHLDNNTKLFFTFWHVTMFKVVTLSFPPLILSLRTPSSCSPPSHVASNSKSGSQYW